MLSPDFYPATLLSSLGGRRPAGGIDKTPLALSRPQFSWVIIKRGKGIHCHTVLDEIDYGVLPH